MTTADKSFFEELASDPHGVLELNAQIAPVIADFLESSLLSPTREGLEAISGDLASLFESAMRKAPKAVVDSIIGKASSTINERASYLLGQISFAQLLASSALQHKASREFLETILDSSNYGYIQSLFERERTNLELSEALSLRVETISRRLRKLREIGVTDFRRDGVSVVNFLTPAAKSVFQQAHPDLVHAKLSNSAHRKVRCAVKNLEPHMQHFQMFGSRVAGR